MNTLTQPKAVLFDWDNTLVDTWPKLHKSLNETLNEFGKPEWTLDEVKQRAHKSSKDAFPIIFGDRSKDAMEFFYHLYKVKYAHEILPPLPHALSILTALKQKNIKAGIVSNKEGNTLRQEIKESGWDIYFDCIIGSRDASQDKPHPEPVYMALDMLNLEKGNHIWFVGDTPVDIECAHHSNCTPILYGDKAAAPNIESLGIPHKHVVCHSGLVKMLENF